MKQKFILILLIFLLFVANGYSKSIKIVTPSTPVLWKIGSSHLIEWSTIGIKGRIFIELLQGDNIVGVIYKGPNDGMFTWEINNFLDGTPIAEGVYKLRVVSKRFSNVFDERKVILTNSPKIYIVDPEGPVTWKIGESHSLGWLSGGVNGNITIGLYKKGKLAGLVYDGANMGVFLWHINHFLGGKQIKNGNYILRVSSKSNPAIFDEVPIAIKLSSKCRIVIISPSKDIKKVAFMGEKFRIIWEAKGCQIPDTEIDIFKVEGNICSEERIKNPPVYSKIIKNNNTLIWDVPEHLLPGLYRVIIKKGNIKISSNCFVVLKKKNFKPRKIRKR